MLPTTVSVIIPSFNHEKYIYECVTSALNQNYNNLEVIVVDDGSTDSTLEILRGFGSKIELVVQQNQGQATARNTGIKLAQGSLISFLDSDDAFVPGKISLQVQKFAGDNTLDLIYTDYTIVNENSKVIRDVKCPAPDQTDMARAMLAGNFICNGTVMLRRECFYALGYFDESIGPVADGDMWLRLLANKYKFGHLPFSLLKYRIHSDNQSQRFMLMQKCRNAMHLKSLHYFSSNSYYVASQDYLEIAKSFARQYSFEAAIESIKISLNRGHSIGKLVMLIALMALNNKVVIFAFSILKKFNLSGRLKKSSIS